VIHSLHGLNYYVKLNTSITALPFSKIKRQICKHKQYNFSDFVYEKVRQIPTAEKALHEMKRQHILHQFVSEFGMKQRKEEKKTEKEIILFAFV
jgi:hypothetical protein